MQSTDIPDKVQTPWANDSTLVTPIPQSTAVAGRASWTQGFSNVNMIPIEAGGVPPFGQDMNGVLQALSAWVRWQGAGGPVAWDSAFNSEVGGYPKGALVAAANGLGWWLSLNESNTNDPDTGGADWLFVPIEQVYAGNPNGNVAGQAASATSPPSVVFDRTNLVFWYCKTTGNAAGAVWTPTTNLIPITTVVGSSKAYAAADVGQATLRSNSGSAMADTLPSNVVDGWNTYIRNIDASALLTISVPTGKRLDGVLNDTLILRPTQSTEVTVDASGNFWLTVPPVPVVFSGQAVYVNVSDTFPPGVYDVDTSAGPITFTLESGGVQGDNYHIRDIAGTFARNNCILNPNGRTIEGQATSFALDVNYTDFMLSLNQPTDWTMV